MNTTFCRSTFPSPALSPSVSRRSFLKCLATASLGFSTTAGAESAAKPLAPGTHKLLMEAPKKGVNAEPMPVHCHVPKGWTAEDPVVVVMHGVGRGAEKYLSNWTPSAEESRMLVIAPEFTATKFPGRNRYNFGNVVNDEMKLQPRAQWNFELADAAFDLVRAATGAKRNSFSLYGHSAGAQFVHRYLLLAPTSRASAIVSANAGSYTVPDYTIPFPWGLKNTEVSADDLRRAFARNVTLALGENDTDPNDANLAKDPEAMAQGPHRFARGKHFFAQAQKKAAELNAPFQWKLVTVPNAGHSDSQMAPAAMRLLRE